MATKLAEYAKKQGAKVIAITDTETSPICPYANYSFFAPVDGVSFSSQVAPLMLTEILLSCTTKLMRDKQQKYHEGIEDIIQELHFFD